MVIQPFREVFNFDEPGFGVERDGAFDGVADGVPVDEGFYGHPSLPILRALAVFLHIQAHLARIPAMFRHTMNFKRCAVFAARFLAGGAELVRGAMVDGAHYLTHLTFPFTSYGIPHPKQV